MHTDIRKLKGRMAELGKTQGDLAQHLNLTAGTVSRKLMDGGLEFSVDQVHRIADWLGLTSTDIARIFFAP